MKIPKIIHQTWKTKEIPQKIYPQEWHESWKKLHPDWEYRLWTDEENNDFIKTHFSWFYPTYKGYDKEIKRVDAVRYFLLYKYGGLYVDLDFFCLKNVGPLFEDYKIVLGQMGNDFENHHSIPNAFMASTPKHPFWESVFLTLEERKNTDPVSFTTGSCVLHSVIKDWRESSHNNLSEVKVCDSKYLFPIHWYNQSLYEGSLNKEVLKNPKKMFPEAYAVTFWTHAWEAPRTLTHKFRKKVLKKTKSLIHRLKKLIKLKKADNLKNFLDAYQKKNPTPKLLQIGGNDGKRADQLYQIISKSNWSGLIVEPVACYYKNLKENYKESKNIKTKQVAVSIDSEKHKTIYRLDEEIIEKSFAQNQWLHGLGSFFKENVASEIKKHFSAEDAKMLIDGIIEENVQCQNLNSLVKEYELESLDLLAIDTQGADYAILESLDFDRIRPKMIFFESYFEKGREECLSHLKKQGYKIKMQSDFDTLMVDRRA